MPWRGPAVAEIEALARELSRLAPLIERGERSGGEDALWEAEVSLRHVSRRAAARADDLRRVIDRDGRLSA